MLRHLLLLIILTISIHGQSQKRYFEGVIEYNVDYTSYMQGVSDNEIKVREGAKIMFYYKDGNYLREYIDEAGYTIRKMYYRKDRNMIYYTFPNTNPDTAFYISAGIDSA